MKFASICSGIGAPECAWAPLGWNCEFTAEIEPFPSAVLKHHYPKVPNYGDITRFKEWPLHKLDVLIGGTPCQSFSVAGLRKGLADPRGNLALTFLAIVERYAPTWIIWENVPGVLSSDEGRAFGAFLGGLAKLGHGFAYRVLDAQYFGLAQRRKRVFVVGHIGGRWRRPPAVLFERESLCGNPAPSREAGQGTAPTISARTKGGGGLGTDAECDGAVIPIQEIGKRQSGTPMNGVGYGEPGAPMFTLQRAAEHGVCCPLVMAHGQSNAEVISDGSPSLTCNHEAPIAFQPVGIDGGEVGFALRSNASHSGDKGDGGVNTTMVAAFCASDYKSGQFEASDTARPLTGTTDRSRGAPLVGDYAVRRLTPRECERLQGFPDDYTLIQHRNKPAADGPRYKALGNSMAVPVIRWLGQQIQRVSESESL